MTSSAPGWSIVMSYGAWGEPAHLFKSGTRMTHYSFDTVCARVCA